MQRIQSRVSGLALAMLAAFPGAGRLASAQDPNQLRARLEYLQQQERTILDQRNWWQAQIRDPEVFLLPADPNTPWYNDRRLPRLMRREAVQEVSGRLISAFVAMRVFSPPTMQELMRDAELQSAEMKNAFQSGLLPAFDRDLQAVRDEFQQLMPRRTQAGQAPPIAPAGRAWYFRRAVFGTDLPNPDFTLLDHDADESGGRVQVRGRVERTNCFETWEMRWKFANSVARLQVGTDVQVSLETQLVSAPCPSPLGSYIAMGGGNQERVILGNAPSPEPVSGALKEEGGRAQADGRTRYGRSSAVVRVLGNPSQSNAWSVFRFQIYMPGQPWVVGYLYLAGGG